MPLQDRRSAAPERARCAGRQQRFSTGRGSGLPFRVSARHHCATPNQEEYLSVSESQRLALYRAAQAALGEEEGDTLMALTPPANTDIATRQDVEHAQALLKADVEHAQALLRRTSSMRRRSDIAHAQALMSAQLDETKGVLQAEVAETKGILQADIARSAAELRSHTWKVMVGTGVALYLAMVATAFAGFGLLLSILDIV
jgi:hypothetical protein